MEHNLFIMETCVDRFRPRLPMSDIQPSPKPGRVKKGESGPRDRRIESTNMTAKGLLRSTIVEDRRAALQEQFSEQSVYPHPSLWNDKGILFVQSITLTIPPQISGHSQVLFFFLSSQQSVQLIFPDRNQERHYCIRETLLVKCYTNSTVV